MAPSKLRDLIRAIRACKTAADERQVVQKECASIRAGFREESNEYRCRNVAKLLYIHMLGYPAHFGQLECLKLVASGRFSDKRIGYLGTMMLLDESKDVHLLVTNSLKNDMSHKTQYVAGLALCTLGSICSGMMARDLAGEVEKLLKSSNAYIRKKAVLAALRIIRKVPDLLENFVPATRSLLGERSHGVLVTGVMLIREMCKQSPDSLAHFRRMVPTLVRILKNLITAGYSHEHDVSGATDPFLQVQILGLLRILGKGDDEASETMNDILAQVATNTDGSKNVGNAILYESVLCIMDIKAESGLRVLAINILGKFLLNNDRNIRYVALTTLLKTVQNSQSSDAVQRHRGTIIDCLKEPDVTIRRRALALGFALINQNNVRALTKELLSFLEIADTEFKSYMVAELLLAAERYAPTKKWHVDTVLEVLRKAGGHFEDPEITATIRLFAEQTEFHGHIVQQLYCILVRDISQQSQTQIAVWCIGEYGNLLGTSPIDDTRGNSIDVNSTLVLDILNAVLESPQSNQLSRQMALMAVMKLSTRFPDQMDRIRTTVGLYGSYVDVELQQRAAEYTTIFNHFNNLRGALLEPMPVPEVKSGDQERSNSTVSGRGMDAPAAAPVQQQQQQGDLLDLMGDDTPAAPVQPVSSSSNSGGGDLLDLLGGLDSGPSSQPALAASSSASNDLMDLMGLMGPSTTSNAQANGGASLLDGLSPQPAASSSMNNGASLLDLMDGPSTSTPMAAPAAVNPSAPQPFTAFDKDGLKITFQVKHHPQNPNIIAVNMSATNGTSVPFQNFVFQAAVPKTCQLQMQPPSGNAIAPNNMGNVTQIINVNNPSQVALRMRLRIQYSVNGTPVEHQGEVNNWG